MPFTKERSNELKRQINDNNNNDDYRAEQLRNYLSRTYYVPSLKFECPKPNGSIECIDRYSSVIDLVVHINDRHHWSFKKIAKWLEKEDLDVRIQTD